MQPAKSSQIQLVLFFILLFVSLHQASGSIFKIKDFYAIHVQGDTTISEDNTYILFAGDYGVRHYCFVDSLLQSFVLLQNKLFKDFQYKVVNYEFIENPEMGDNSDCQLAPLSLLLEMGFDAVSLAHNHSMDYGREGIEHNVGKVVENRLNYFGFVAKPHINVKIQEQDINLYSLTSFIDKPDVDNSICFIDDRFNINFEYKPDPNQIDIAILHVGSRSAYPNPHEVKKIKKLLRLGFHSVVCIGSHWPKGYALMDGKPVYFGLGNYLFSYAEGGTETTGMFLVYGLKDNKIVQQFLLPFHNDLFSPNVKPCTRDETLELEEVLIERSSLDAKKFYSDSKTKYGLVAQLKEIKLSDLSSKKKRHIKYGLITVYVNYFWYFTVTVTLIVMVMAWLFLRKRRKKRNQKI